MSQADDEPAGAVWAAAEAVALAAEELERVTREQACGLPLVDLPAATAALARTGMSLSRVYGAFGARVEHVRVGVEPGGDVDWVTRELPETLESAGRAAELMASRGHDLGIELMLVPLVATVQVGERSVVVSELNGLLDAAFRVALLGDEGAPARASWETLPAALDRVLGGELADEQARELADEAYDALNDERRRRRSQKPWTNARGARAVRDALADFRRSGDRLIPPLAEGLALLDQDFAESGGALVPDEQDWGEPLPASEVACLEVLRQLLKASRVVLAEQQQPLLRSVCEQPRTLDDIQEGVAGAAAPVSRHRLPAVLADLVEQGLLERSVDDDGVVHWQTPRHARKR